MPKETQLLMKGPLVCATLEDRKTQTRRLNGLDAVNLDAGHPSAHMWKYQGVEPVSLDHLFIFADGINTELIKCPYGKPGDRLWVRETFCLESNYGIDDELGYPPPFKDGRPINWNEDEYNGKYWEQPHYRATDPEPELCVEGKEDPGVSWKPSIHMPRWASRINLEITNIRVERVQDISEKDAKAEGIQLKATPQGNGLVSVSDKYSPLQYVQPRQKHESPHHVIERAWKFIPHFAALWDSINAKRGYGWAENPWVWVIEFKREG